MRQIRVVLSAVLVAGAVVLHSGTSIGQDMKREAQGDRRDLRLVVLLTVDQFRFDYLTRFGDSYNSGLARG